MAAGQAIGDIGYKGDAEAAAGNATVIAILKRLRTLDDDFTSFEAQHVTLVAATSTQITFAQQVRMIRILNWDLANVLLVKASGAITGASDAAASRIGYAPAVQVPNPRNFPYRTTNGLYLYSAGASTVTVEGYF